MPVKITYFVHGTTTDNENGIATGWAPGELSELGIRQAKELGGLKGNEKFDAIFCSDLKRAVDTAELAFGEKYEIIPDQRLREANYGDNTQKPAKEFKSDMNDFVDAPFPNGESYKDVEKRMADFCQYLKANYNGKCVAIVSHQAPQLSLEVLLKKKTWKQAIAEYWGNAGEWQPGWEYIIGD